ncbi:MAG: ABC transporter ATP-binding protein [Alphaproteobacteria bacterium]|nr:ABC transporter ATP-binding protein [Alphaproteobacteria bacterium]
MVKNNKTIIDIRGVGKNFAATQVLKKIDLQMKEGEFFSLLGPSGCGKTTLLRIISGFEKQSFGHVFIDGQDMTDIPPDQRPTKMVFQSYAIFPHLSVFDNVAYGLRRIAAAERKKRVMNALQQVALDHLADRMPHQLSGGQRQRVALSRAFVMQPKVMLLDEPLSALDKKLRDQMRDELRKLQRKLGITFVLVTHDQEEALTLSDRIGVMFQGELTQVDTPAGLYQSPKNKVVADFIGGMNFIEATVEGQSGKELKVRIGGFGLCTIAAPASYKGEKTLAAGIRPEQLSILTGTGLKAEQAVKAKVSEVTYYGEMTYYSVALPGLKKPLDLSMRNLIGRRIFEVGDEVEVGWSPQAFVVWS